MFKTLFITLASMIHLYYLSYSIYIIIKSTRNKSYTIISEDILLLRNYRIFNVEMIYQVELFHRETNCFVQSLMGVFQRDKKGKLRKKNPFRKMSDNEQYEIIKTFRSKQIADYIMYGCGETPSDYLQREVNKLKLHINFKE